MRSMQSAPGYVLNEGSPGVVVAFLDAGILYLGGASKETHSETCWMNKKNFFFSVARSCREQSSFMGSPTTLSILHPLGSPFN